MTVFALYIGNANDVRVKITDPRNDSEPVTDATLAGQLTTAADVNVGASIPLNHDALGVYLGTWPDTLALVEGDAYKGILTDSAKGVRVEVPYVAVQRTGVRPSQGRLDAIARAAGVT